METVAFDLLILIPLRIINRSLQLLITTSFCSMFKRDLLSQVISITKRIGVTSHFIIDRSICTMKTLFPLLKCASMSTRFVHGHFHRINNRRTVEMFQAFRHISQLLIVYSFLLDEHRADNFNCDRQ